MGFVKNFYTSKNLITVLVALLLSSKCKIFLHIIIKNVKSFFKMAVILTSVTYMDKLRDIFLFL
jgi:hypothetical protein